MPGFLGDRKHMIVHHLANRQPSCNVYEIQKLDKQYFTPDKITTAIDQGFIPCTFCNE